jgi:hypothetical protein
MAEYLRKYRDHGRPASRLAAAVKAGAKLTFGTDAGVYAYGLGRASLLTWCAMNDADAGDPVGDQRSRASARQGGAKSDRSRRERLEDFIEVRGDPLKDVAVLEKVDGDQGEGSLPSLERAEGGGGLPTMPGSRRQEQRR